MPSAQERALSGELELLRNEGLFVDKERLKGGDFYNDALARALYESATLIVVYQPNYFDAQHAYCAREYRGMCSLERQRLALSRHAEDRDHGLIIPLILRGERDIPNDLAARRHYADFSRFMLLDEELSKHPDYAPKIREIAEYINARCQCLDGSSVPVFVYRVR